MQHGINSAQRHTRIMQNIDILHVQKDAAMDDEEAAIFEAML